MMMVIVLALTGVAILLLWALALSYSNEQQYRAWQREWEVQKALYEAINDSRGLADVLDRQGKVIDRTYVRTYREE